MKSRSYLRVMADAKDFAAVVAQLDLPSTPPISSPQWAIITLVLATAVGVLAVRLAKARKLIAEANRDDVDTDAKASEGWQLLYAEVKLENAKLKQEAREMLARLERLENALAAMGHDHRECERRASEQQAEINRLRARVAQLEHPEGTSS